MPRACGGTTNNKLKHEDMKSGRMFVGALGMKNKKLEVDEWVNSVITKAIDRNIKDIIFVVLAWNSTSDVVWDVNFLINSTIFGIE